MSVLFVCQGNTCRSAVAERLAALWARETLGAPAETAGLHICSAGLGATDGAPMHPMSAAALQELGGDPGPFRASLYVPAMADEAGLVLTMTERQRRSVLVAAPRGMRRTFTLEEAAALLPLADVTDLTAVALADRPAELGRRLDEARARRPSPQWEDIRDPLGQRAGVHRDTAQRIAAALRPLADLLFSASSSGEAIPRQRLRAAVDERPPI